MLNTVISGWLLCGLEVGDSHTLIPTTMWWLISVDWCFLSSTLQLLPLSFSPLHLLNGFPHQWQLGHNWLVTSLRQIGLVLCPILTQKSPTFSSHLCRKMDGSSLTPLPCCSPLSSHWLRKRQYLVSQPRWGEHFVRKEGHCLRVTNLPLTRIRPQHPLKKTKGLHLLSSHELLKMKPRVWTVLIAPVCFTSRQFILTDLLWLCTLCGNFSPSALLMPFQVM